MSSLDDSERLLSIGLLNVADDEGYFLARPASIRSLIWPLDEDSTKARRSLAQLEKVGWIEVRHHPTHGPIGLVVNFTKHQKIDRPSPSRIKGYFVNGDSTNARRTLDERSLLDQGSGIKVSGIKGSSDQGSDNTINDTPSHASCGESESDQEWVSVSGSEVPMVPADGPDSDPKAGGDQAQDPKPKRKRRTADDFFSHGFQEFWQAYPKRVGIAQAYDHWCDKMTPDERRAAAYGVDEFIAGKEIKFLPDPIRYLRNKRWMDEPVPEPDVPDDHVWNQQ